MPLRPDISELQHHVFRKLSLNRQIVLRRVLSAQVRLELAIEENRAKQRVIHGLAGRGGQNAVERIRRRCASRLVNERSVKDVSNNEELPPKGGSAPNCANTNSSIGL